MRWCHSAGLLALAKTSTPCPGASSPTIMGWVGIAPTSRKSSFGVRQSSIVKMTITGRIATRNVNCTIIGQRPITGVSDPVRPTRQPPVALVRRGERHAHKASWAGIAWSGLDFYLSSGSDRAAIRPSDLSTRADRCQQLDDQGAVGALADLKAAGL